LIGSKEDQDASDVLEDEPIDRLGYSISCSLPAWHNEEGSKISRLPQLFHEVSTPEERKQHHQTSLAILEHVWPLEAGRITEGVAHFFLQEVSPNFFS
jgi:hypothetical protein